MEWDKSQFEERWRRIAELYQTATELLAGLDELKLHEAGAHLSLAMRAMRETHPDLSLPDIEPPTID